MTKAAIVPKGRKIIYDGKLGLDRKEIRKMIPGENLVNYPGYKVPFT